MKKSERMRHVPGRVLLLLCLLTGVSGCAGKADEFVSLSELEEEAGAQDLSAASGADETGSSDSSAVSDGAGVRNSSAVSGGTESSAPSAVLDGAGARNSSAASGGIGTSDSSAVLDGPSAASDGSVPLDPSAAESAESPEAAKIYVDVCGAVVNPGVYRLKAGSRVFQAVKRAGGLLPDAAGEYVNQARSLADGDQIYIPTRDEAEAGGLPEPEGRAGKHVEEEKMSGESSGTSGGEKINLNTADLTALMTLTGIGESKARAILAYREECGGFSSIEEICNVQGIKEGTFGRIKDKIVVE